MSASQPTITLERKYSLEELVSLSLLKELTEELAFATGMGIRVSNRDGRQLANTNAASPGRPGQIPEYFEEIICQGDTVGTLYVLNHAKAPQPVFATTCQRLKQCFEALAFGGFERESTNQAHMASITAAYEDLKASNEKLQASYERLQELNRLKTNFLAAVSHELKTPLTSIIGYSELLKEGVAGPLNNTQHKYIVTVLTRSKDLLTMIDSLLELSMTESGNFRLERMPTPLKYILDDTERRVAAAVTERAAKLEIAPPVNCPPLVVDRDRLVRALSQLVENAVKFGPDKGLVKITNHVQREKGQDFVAIAVTDFGPGIPAEETEKIFDSFYQIDGGSTRAHGGVGMGLTMAKRFAQAHGGDVSVRSKPGEGSTFTLTIPLAPPPETPASGPENPATPADGPF